MRLDLKKSTFFILTILVLSLGVLGISFGVSNYLKGMGKGSEQESEKMAAGSCSINFLAHSGAGSSEKKSIAIKSYNCDEPIPASDLATYAETANGGIDPDYLSNFENSNGCKNCGTGVLGWFRDDGTRYFPNENAFHGNLTLEYYVKNCSNFSTVTIKSGSETLSSMVVKNGEKLNAAKISSLFQISGIWKPDSISYSPTNCISGVCQFPHKYGYAFRDYYTNDALTWSLTEESVTSNRTIYIGWDEGVEVIYRTVGQYWVSQSYALDDTIILYDYPYYSNNNLDTEWYYDTEYNNKVSTTKTLRNSPYSSTSGVNELIIYAKSVERQQDIEVEVSFNKNASDAVLDLTKKTVVYGQTYGTLPVPTRTGYTFAGWFANANGANRVLSTTKVTNSSDHSLYAIWNTNTYYIKYNANGGTGTMSNQTVLYNNQVVISSNGFTRSGYTFNGWNTKADGSGTGMSVGQVVKNLTSTAYETINLYAMWKLNSTPDPDPTTYKITYYKNDGTTTNTVKTTTGSFTTLGNSTWTRSGYTLNSWYTTANGSGGTPYALNSSYSTTKNLSLYAQWKANSYTVTFNPLGGSLSSYIKNVTYNQAYGTLPIPSKTDYTFDGWYIDNGTFKNKVISTNTYNTASNTTLYAKYNPITVEVTFDPFGGSVDEQKRIVNKNTAIGTLPFARKTNDGFLGWYTDPFFDSEVTKDTIVSGTMTLYAKYQSDIFTLNTVTNYKIYKNNFVLFNEKQKTNTLNVNEGYTLSYYPAKGRTNITYMGTGDSLILYKTSNGHNNQTYTIIVLGDANGDGMINSGDLYSIQSHLLNKKTLGTEFRVAADANKDNAVNSGDLYKIQSYLLGKSTMD